MAAMDEQRSCRHAIAHETASAAAIKGRGFGAHRSTLIANLTEPKPAASTAAARGARPTSRTGRLNDLLASKLLAPANLGLHLCPIRTVVMKAFVVIHLVSLPTHSITKSPFAADLAVTGTQSFSA